MVRFFSRNEDKRCAILGVAALAVTVALVATGAAVFGQVEPHNGPFRPVAGREASEAVRAVVERRGRVEVAPPAA